MSDELIISGGGSYAVATEEMLSNAAHLLRASDMTRDIAGAIQMVDARLTMGQLESLGIPTGVALAESDLVDAHVALESFAQRAEELSSLVRFAAQSYGFGEAVTESIVRRLSADIAVAIGFLFSRWVVGVALTSPVLPLLAGIGVAAFLLGRLNPQQANSEWMSEQFSEFISDPAFVLALRHGVMTADELGAGALGVPPEMVSMLSAAGLIGLGTSAGFIQRAGGVAGVFQKTPVTLVTSTPPAQVSTAESFEERLSRIPQPSAEEPAQIRVERYEKPGELPRFEVYLSGTVDFAVADTTEPFDSTSNIANAVGGDGASVAAVTAAMREAGITNESHVIINGYSQSAATAARVAESGEFNIQGLVLAGGNTGQIHIPSGIPTVIIEHTDDLVVASGGLQDNGHALVVERQAFGGRTLPVGVPVPAHHLSEYRETARLMDQSDSVEIRSAIDGLTQSGRSATPGTVTTYHYERVVP